NRDSLTTCVANHVPMLVMDGFPQRLLALGQVDNDVPVRRDESAIRKGPEQAVEGCGHDHIHIHRLKMFDRTVEKCLLLVSVYTVFEENRLDWKPDETKHSLPDDYERQDAREIAAVIDATQPAVFLAQ